MTTPLPASPTPSLQLDPKNLKGLAHPLRVRILGSLREEGSATASMLAARLGESSGATSYHLRQLEAFGFIVEDPSRPSRRERWWRAAQASTHFEERCLAQGGETALLGAEFLRAIAQGHTARMARWLQALPQVPAPWNGAGTLSDWALRLTPEQAQSLQAQILALIQQFPAHDPDEPLPTGTALVAVQLQILPKVEPIAPS